MFERLFAETGLSLDRLRALVEVGAHGSIVKAAAGEPVRQSLFSRQIKELEDFFQVPLLERQGRGVRLTPQGRELSRISRFFLLGLSNFQRGCLAEGQSYRIGADQTFIEYFLLPVISVPDKTQWPIHFSVEIATGEQVERRLHDLTLDFGVVTQSSLSRPLQCRELGVCRLVLWMPKSLAKTAEQGVRLFHAKQLPLVWAAEIGPASESPVADCEPALVCGSFVQAKEAMRGGKLAGFLPEFIEPPESESKFLKINLEPAWDRLFRYSLAWNPRLLRLNPHAARRRDVLSRELMKRLGSRVLPGTISTRRIPGGQTRGFVGDSPRQTG